MEKSELIQFLRENLRLQSNENRQWYGDVSVSISIELDGQTITETSFSLPKECSCSCSDRY